VASQNLEMERNITLIKVQLFTKSYMKHMSICAWISCFLFRL